MKEEEKAKTEFEVELKWELPAHFPQASIPEDNPLTVEKVELGRWLFYDQQLSSNGTRSCGICHEQAKAFTDGFVRAVGNTNEMHSLNTLSMVNIAWREQLGWRDPDLYTLTEQLLIPLFGDDPIEMNMTEEILIERIQNFPIYSSLFAEAYPESDDPISLDNISKALASFQRRIISGNSPYDRWLQGDENAMSESQKRGLILFESEELQCRRCHGGLFFDSEQDEAGVPVQRHGYFNTGLYNIDDAGSYPSDEQGLIQKTGLPEDMGKFRTPSLRNVEYTGPWTHDGTVLELGDLIDAYARGGRLVESGPWAGDGASNPWKSELIGGFVLSAEEREELLNFLNALSDDDLLVNVELASPFCIEAEGEITNEPCEPQAGNQ